jgi:hypothetical protein
MMSSVSLVVSKRQQPIWETTTPTLVGTVAFLWIERRNFWRTRMKIVMIFHMNNDQYDALVGQDLHAQDILDDINELATEQDTPDEIWHIQDDKIVELIEAIGKVAKISPLDKGILRELEKIK